MRLLRHCFLALLVSMLLACGGNDDDPRPNPAEPPQAATLIFPEDNTECNEGEVVSDTESAVTFQWNTSENTDSYTVNLTNLNSGTSESFDVGDTERTITILRGVPYEWSVSSKADGTSETAESPSWKFYNAGAATQSHPPFPADVVTPIMGSQIEAGAVTLSWEVSDIDNDIVSYEVFLDGNNPPETLIGSPTTANLDWDAQSGTIYYWKVVTFDSVGNTSESDVFQFKVN